MNKDTIKNNIAKTEVELVHLLQEKCPGMKYLRLILDDPYSSFDAHTKDFIVEFKYRYKSYNDTMIEKGKLERNIAAAKELGKRFLYIVSDPSGVYAFSINKLIEDKYDFNWTTMDCPTTSAFDNNNKISKVVHNLPKSLAQWKWLAPEITEPVHFDPISLFK